MTIDNPNPTPSIPWAEEKRRYWLNSSIFSCAMGSAWSRDYLYERFWPHEEVSSSRPLDTHIYRLRNELGLTADRG